LSNSTYAGVVSRIAALAADITLLMVADLAIGSMPRLVWEQLVIRPAPHWLTTGSAMVAALLPWSYFTACWWLSGQTAGNRLFGIAVQRPDGRALSFPRAAGRAALCLVLVPLWIVGFIAMLWDQRRRAWHDRLAGTVVRYVGSR
jgi:uncharacterized RDD family membrane protein YckC